MRERKYLQYGGQEEKAFSASGGYNPPHPGLCGIASKGDDNWNLYFSAGKMSR